MLVLLAWMCFLTLYIGSLVEHLQLLRQSGLKVYGW